MYIGLQKIDNNNKYVLSSRAGVGPAMHSVLWELLREYGQSVGES